MKLITFSLWGQDPKYTLGALKNAELSKTIYPGWKCRFYLGASVPKPIEYDLQKHDHVELVNRPEWGDWRGMFWRFEPAGEEDVEVMISRDCDSRLNKRAALAVQEWLESDKTFHIMRDHPHHRFPVLGGMWGAKKGAIPDMKSMIDNWDDQDKYGTDYEFFAHSVIPRLNENDIMVHDPFFGGLPFPEPRDGLEFVGQVYDENEETVSEHLEALKKYLK